MGRRGGRVGGEEVVEEVEVGGGGLALDDVVVLGSGRFGGWWKDGVGWVVGEVAVA